MDALVAKAAVLDQSRKRKRFHPGSKKKKEETKFDGTLASVAGRTGLPRSLATSAASTSTSPAPSHKHIKDKKLRAHLVSQSAHAQLTKTLNAEVEDPLFADEIHGDAVGIQVEGELEKTWRISQDEIVKSVGEEAGRMRRELKLDGGPYRIRYTRNGRHLAIIGKKGHVATFDALTGNIHSELQLKETCRDITFLQDTSFHAIAQKKSVFIYDKSGVEIHRLSSLLEPTRLTFLPYHYVLVCASLTGHLNYLDTTTGAIIAKHNSHLGACEVMDQNPQNAVVGMGHRNGQVTFWTPNVNEPVVRLMAHLGPVSGFAHWGEDGLGGRTLATAGVDGIVKIWDARMWKDPTRQWALRKSSTASVPELSFSQKGHLALTTGSGVNVYIPVNTWSSSPSHTSSAPPLYLTHPFPSKEFSPLTRPTFSPFFDALTVGHGRGFSTLLVPGSAEGKWDSMEADPFENVKMRREREVRGLLDRINPALITLDPEFVGTVDTRDIPQKRVDVASTPFARLPRMERLKLSGKADLEGEEDGGAGDANGVDEDEGEEGGGEKRQKTVKDKNKMRGKNKSLKRHLRKKRKNIIDPATIAIREKIERQRALIAKTRRKEKDGEGAGEDGGEVRKSALDRFRK